MDQEKIGRFIALLRKEKGMTQMDLANKIGVTDRAISKWENGRGMPELSLIKPLCDEIGVTVNELLSGERIKKQEYQEKFEENMVKTIEYSNKKLKKARRVSKIMIASTLICIIILVTLFLIDINRMNNNKPVLFSTWGYSYYPPIDLHQEEIEIVITDYLNNKNENTSKHYNNEKWFASLKIYLIEEKENKTIYNVYAWVVEESYYLENGNLKKDSGSSIPYKFVVEKNETNYIVSDMQVPRDGDLYNIDMKNIFPRSVRKEMDNIHNDATINKLKLEINKQVRLYFNK